jgi:hypothetical protein
LVASEGVTLVCEAFALAISVGERLPFTQAISALKEGVALELAQVVRLFKSIFTVHPDAFTVHPDGLFCALQSRTREIF